VTIDRFTRLHLMLTHYMPPTAHCLLLTAHCPSLGLSSTFKSPRAY